jgi:diguanylate cyclase (GGDEF)-like protein
VSRSELRRARDEPDRRHRRRFLYLYAAAVIGPLLGYLVVALVRDPAQLTGPSAGYQLLIWMVAIAGVDLLPVPAGGTMSFSLSFPLELSAALIYPPPVAALVAFVGSSDIREFRGEISPLKSISNRAQVALSVVAESLVFHSMASIGTIRWYELGPAVLAAAIVGYVVNTLVVAGFVSLDSGQPIVGIIREMHVGVFGEFVLSYMGLALFSVLVAVSFSHIGPWAILVFIAPLAFARQMFTRTHSLQVATEELAERQAENEFQALHDALTGLPNRVLFQQQLSRAIEQAEDDGTGVGVMLMDLDHFKEINDTLGHHFGDQLLKEIGPRLSTVLREDDLMARLGGDEFGVLLPDLPDEQVALAVARRLLEELELPVSVEGLALDVSGSIGIALFPGQSRRAESLIRRADVAMYAAKETGGGFELYDGSMDQHSPSQLTLVSQVRPALESGQMTVHYQPKVRLRDGRVSGAEALVRWHHPTRGLVMPDEFIPLVEKTVLLRPLTLFVIDEVLRRWRGWSARGFRLPVAVNISPRSLLDLQFPEQVAELLERWKVPAGFLTLELTESFLMTESGRSTAVLDRLAALGVSLSIDDFGTGYSSLSHLQRLKIDEIKIDKSFVMHMHDDANDFTIVRATVELGQNLGLTVVAEGVEDRETFDRLADFGCHEAQGFYISEPLSVEAFDRWLSVRSPEAIVFDERGDPPPQEPPGRLRVV